MIPSELVLPVNVLSPRTVARLEAGLSLWHQGAHDAILVTGGLYMDPCRQTIASGTLMRDFLIARGIRADDVLAETGSRDTYENVRLGLQRLADAGMCAPEVTIVSHPTHLRRFKAAFKAYGLTPRLCSVPYALSLKEWCLELLMYACHLIDRKGQGFIARRNRRRRSSLAGPIAD